MQQVSTLSDKKTSEWDSTEILCGNKSNWQETNNSSILKEVTDNTIKKKK